MARRTTPKKTKRVEDYEHTDAKRLNNPPSGLAQYDTEKPPKRRFEYDPHLDPQLVWAGKAERQSFEVEAPSIHVHERLSTEAIIRAVQKEPAQPALFGDEELDRSKAVEFYQHEQGWVNRLILGDSLVVITSLLEKERLGGQVQMIYIDPPYGINYNSNFQARIGEKSPSEKKDTTITREPEQVQAYRDTWQLGVHSYMTYLRDRLLACRELLSDSGSIFVQIGVDRLHLVRCLLDEIFGSSNACSVITLRKTSGHASRLLPEISDFLLWYAKDKGRVKFHQLYEERHPSSVEDATYQYVLLPDGSTRKLSEPERADIHLLPEGSRIYKLDNATSEGFSTHKSVDLSFRGAVFNPGPNKHWKLRTEGMERLASVDRLEVKGRGLWYRRFLDDFGATALPNIWMDTSSSFATRRFIVQTVPKIVERALLMTTDPGDLTLDPTCGSGTTAWVAEKHGRRWITIDTSRVALAIARERLLTAKYAWYGLRDESRGVDSGLEYRAISRVTMSSIGYDQPPETETLYHQPRVDSHRVRVSGPFTVEALSRYSVNPLQGSEDQMQSGDSVIGETQGHVSTLLDALEKQGIPASGTKLKVESLEPIAGSGAIQAAGRYRANGKERSFGVSLGPRFGPVTVAQIDEALRDSYGYELVVFVGFAATAEAQQYTAKGTLGKFNVALLAANPDLLVGDLLKSTSSSQTFRLFSSPEAGVIQDKDGEVRVKVLGVDTFDPATGEVTSGNQKDIAAWFLDQDYDGIVFHVNQAFFPKTGGWEALQRALKATVEEDLMEQLASFESLPFRPGEQRKAAIRVVDDFGTTSEALLDL